MVADPATFTSFIGNVAKHVTVDNSLTDDEIRRTALSLRLTGKDIDAAAGPDLRLRHRRTGRASTSSTQAKLAELSKALKKDTGRRTT